MNFIKKNVFYIVLTVFAGLVLFVPEVKELIQKQILMSPSLKKMEEEITISEDEFNLSLKGINVPDANLKDFKGQTVFLNFWATWCPSCRAEMPSIQEFYNTKKAKVSFVLIAIENDEQKVRDFIKKNNYNFPVYIPKYNKISEKIAPKIFPTTFIVGRDGRILKKETGALNWNSQSVHEFVDAVSKD